MKKFWKHGALAGGILLLSVIISHLLSQQKEPLRRRPVSVDEQHLDLMTVQHMDLTLDIRMTGPLYAYHRVDLYAEVSGILQNTHPPFKAGLHFKDDQVLLNIDDRVYRNNVLAQRSGLLNQITLLLPDLKIDFPESADIWESYLKSYRIEENLQPLPEAQNDQERYYIASRNIYQQYYTIKSMEETLAKYTLRAPFPGVVALTQVNPGTLVRIGQKLGEFVGTDLYEMEAAVTLDEAGQLHVGQAVHLSSEDMQGSFQGIIQRINSVVDRASMTVKVYIHSVDSRLRDGMYMSAVTQGLPVPHVVELHRDLLRDGHVFIVLDSVLVLYPVTVVADAGERVFVRGLTDGMVILNEAWAEAKPGKRLPDLNGFTSPASENLKSRKG
ncbi:HlyD family efflux transporter periplasmic adaptor subunit [bacterium]|nr:HlyD family efflux transporter periplasmic adaptor subunit [bacterium]